MAKSYQVPINPLNPREGSFILHGDDEAIEYLSHALYIATVAAHKQKQRADQINRECNYTFIAIVLFIFCLLHHYWRYHV